MRDRWVRSAGWGLVCLVVVGLVGCQGRDEPTTTPTPVSQSASASPTPSESVDEQALIDQAVAALTEYLALANEVENNGGEGWEELRPWWGHEEMTESGTAHFTTLIENGWRTEGSTRIISIEGSVRPESQLVDLAYCLDATQVRAVDSSGAEFAEVSDAPFPVDAEMQLGTRWQVLDIRPRWEESC